MRVAGNQDFAAHTVLKPLCLLVVFVTVSGWLAGWRAPHHIHVNKLLRTNDLQILASLLKELLS